MLQDIKQSVINCYKKENSESVVTAFEFSEISDIQL